MQSSTARAAQPAQKLGGVETLMLFAWEAPSELTGLQRSSVQYPLRLPSFLQYHSSNTT